MIPFSKINAPEVYAIPIQDNAEPLIDLLVAYPELFVDQTRQYSQKVSKSISYLRKGVADRLKLTAESLPTGTRFKIIEGHRSLGAQQHIFDKTMKEVRGEHPDWSDQQVYEKTSTFVAPPDNTPPHSTGGAIDLMLMTPEGKELNMGTDLNKGYDGTCFTAAQVSEEARKNRQILINAMQKAGFVNYPAEWWHWSYGDRYWAHITGAPFAIYGSK